MHPLFSARKPFLLSTLFLLSSVVGLASVASAEDTALPRTPAPEGATAYIIAPADGATVSSPVLVRFGLSGIGVAPAGVVNPKTGHHHLIIDSEVPAVGMPIPADAKRVHFGKGQTETSIELAPGPHTLRLLLGDRIHVPHDPPVVSEVIHIVVEAGTP